LTALCLARKALSVTAIEKPDMANAAISDLSGGASVEDIVTTCAVMAATN
jgi:hypothetical protein